MTRSDAISTSFLLSSSARSMPNCFLSFPIMLGDAQHLHLYKLFLVVKGKEDTTSFVVGSCGIQSSGGI